MNAKLHFSILSLRRNGLERKKTEKCFKILKDLLTPSSLHQCFSTLVPRHICVFQVFTLSVIKSIQALLLGHVNINLLL